MVEPVKQEETICPECGAPRVEGLTCWEQLGGILAWEYQDPDFRAEHFLTVAAYNLQHPAQFTAAVMADLRAAMIEHLDHGVSVEALRRWAAQTYGGQKRVLKPEVLRRWQMTIVNSNKPCYHRVNKKAPHPRRAAWIR